MSFLKNTAQSIYFLLLDVDGNALTGKSPSAYVTLDQGTQSAAAGTTTELANGQYRFDGTAGDFNGDEVGLLFMATSAIPVSVAVKTDTKAVGTLNDLSQAEANVACDTALTDYDPPTKNELDALQTHGDSTWSTADVSNLDVAVSTRSSHGDPDPSGYLDAAISSRSTLTQAQVNAQVVDVLKTDTVSEMAQGALPTSPTLEQMINYLYRYLRNKTTTTGSKISVYADDGSTVLFQATLSDDGTTFTKAEHVSG